MRDEYLGYIAIGLVILLLVVIRILVNVTNLDFTNLQIIILTLIIFIIIYVSVNSVMPKIISFKKMNIDNFLNYFTENLKIIIRSDYNVKTNKIYTTLDEQITNAVNRLISIDNQSPPILKKDIYETTKKFEDRVKLASLGYKKRIEWQVKRRDKYLEVLNKIKKDGNKKTLIEKIFRKDNDIHKRIFDTYAKAIKEYYSNPYLANIIYNADTKEIGATLKFVSSDNYAQYLLFTNITPVQAKRIIEDKDYIVEVIFETNFNEMYIADIFLLNYEKKFQGEVVNKNTYQLKSLEMKIDQIETIIKPVKIEIQQQKVNFTDEYEYDYANKLKELEKNFESKYEVQNKLIKSVDDKIERLNAGAKDMQIEELKLQSQSFQNTLTSQSNEIKELQNKLIEKEQNTKNLVDSFVSKIESHENKKSTNQSENLKFKELEEKFESKYEVQNKFIKSINDELERLNVQITNSVEDKQSEELKLQSQAFQNTLTSQSNEIKELQNKLNQKEQDIKNLTKELISKINKLEEKIAKQKVAKTQIPLNIPTEKQSIKKDDGVIVKRESFDDF